MKKILVIGSSNTDLIATMNHFPTPGETLEGTSFQLALGGKGANQAIAAQRTGGNVTFITSLGNDLNGRNALKYYKEQGLDVSNSLMNDNETTGTAIIWVDEQGENSIVIIPGANNLLSSDYIIANREIIEKTDIVVLQMEIPYETVKTTCEIASKLGKTVILNVAPAYKLDDEVLKAVHFLIVNENEAEVLTGEKFKIVHEEVIINKLLQRGVKNVILTLGHKGCIFKNENEYLKIPAYDVKAIDSTAAGDTFCGALATGISKNRNIKVILEYANAAAALCVTRLGAQPSIPNEDEVNRFLINKNSILN